MKILITGGASGLGKAITEKLAQEPNNFIYFTYKSSIDKALAIEKSYPNTKSFLLDFNNENSINEFIDKMTEILPDVLINNAITGYTQNHFHKLESQIFQDSFMSNIYPTLKITQKFINIRRKIKSGKIITILTSAVINKPPIGFSEYVANKAYLYSMAKSWATENIAFGITSNCISPSFMQTNLTADTDTRLVENMISDNPNKRLLREEEVADVVLFLINTTSQINGQNIIINAAKDLV